MLRSGHCPREKPSRREFLTTAIAAAGALHLTTRARGQDRLDSLPQVEDIDSVNTNVARALAAPRGEKSMPGPYPGLVVEVEHAGAVSGRSPDAGIVAAMLASGMKSLTGAGDERDAWSSFFDPSDRIGIKINSVGGGLVGTSHALVAAAIAALESIGVPRKNLTLWDHYEDALSEWEFSAEEFPGVEFQCLITFEEGGSGDNPKSLERFDKSQFYWADHVLPAEQNLIPYMLNSGPESYFPLLLTQGVDKILNIPSLKHHRRAFVTLCLKNLAYGATTNCIRGHDFIHRYIPEVCAFPCFRDKTVLNIVDGLRAQYNAGPSAVAQYIWNHNRVYLATDPVAADSVGFDVIFKKQVEMGTSKANDKEDYYRRFDLLTRAENLGLGVFKGRAIELRKA